MLTLYITCREGIVPATSIGGGYAIKWYDSYESARTARAAQEEAARIARLIALAGQMRQDGFEPVNISDSSLSDNRYLATVSLGACELPVNATAVTGKDGMPADLKDYEFIINGIRVRVQNVQQLESPDIQGPHPCNTVIAGGQRGKR